MHTDKDYNPLDPLYLASRAMDESLTLADAETLTAALASSLALRQEVDQFRRLHAAVKSWGRSAAPQVDISANVVSQISRDRLKSASQSDGELDALLAHWSSRDPDVDWGRFHEDSMRRIQMNASAPSRNRALRWFRIGFPIAAAAAIVLAFVFESMPPRPTALDHGIVKTGNSSDAVVSNVRGDDPSPTVVETIGLVEASAADAEFTRGGSGVVGSSTTSVAMLIDADRPLVVWRRAKSVAVYGELSEVLFARRPENAAPPFETGWMIGYASVGSQALTAADEAPPL